MKKLLKSIRLHLEDGKFDLEMNYLQLEKTWVDGNEVLQLFQSGCLIERNHDFQQTQIVLDEAGPCVMMIFDKNSKFITMKLSYASGNAPYSVLISEPIILLLPANSNMLELSIKSLQIISNKSNT